MTVATVACENKGYTITRKGSFARAAVTQPVDACADCSGTGLLRGQTKDNGRIYDTVSPCPRARMEHRVKLFNAAELPAIHSNSTLQTYQPGHDEEQHAKRVVAAFLHSWPVPKGFLISGPCGTGKTHLLASVIRHLTLERGVSCQYVETTLLYATIRMGFKDGKSGGEIIQPMSEVQVLVIDELGNGRGSQFELDTLAELVSRRYNAGAVTLFATNFLLDRSQYSSGYLTTASLVESGKDSKLLHERVGERIFSRLSEMCEFIEMPNSTIDRRRSQNQVDPRQR